jgi:hypothetical protein
MMIIVIDVPEFLEHDGAMQKLARLRSEQEIKEARHALSRYLASKLACHQPDCGLEMTLVACILVLEWVEQDENYFSDLLQGLQRISPEMAETVQ